MEIPTVRVCRCILEAKGIVPLPRNYSLCITPIEILMLRVRRCIPEAKGIVLLPFELFTMHNTDENTNELKIISVFQRGRQVFPFSCR
jgi:hypothetical protein